jgi:transcriptional regulator with XRE-family HTH domain
MGVPRRLSLHTAEYVAFRRRLAEARHEAGLTQRDLAKLMRKSQAWLYKCEAGERRVDAVELAKFAKALKRPIDWFVSHVKLPGAAPEKAE